MNKILSLAKLLPVYVLLVIAGMFCTSTVMASLVSVDAIPIPATVWLFGAGFVGLIGVARKKKRVLLKSLLITGAALLTAVTAGAKADLIEVTNENYESGVALDYVGDFSVAPIPSLGGNVIFGATGNYYLQITGPATLGGTLPPPTEKTFLLPAGLKQVVIDLDVVQEDIDFDANLFISFVGEASLNIGAGQIHDGYGPVHIEFETSADSLLFRLISKEPAGLIVADGFWGIDNLSITATTVPVPSAVWLFGSGLLGLAGIARRTNVGPGSTSVNQA